MMTLVLVIILAILLSALSSFVTYYYVSISNKEIIELLGTTYPVELAKFSYSLKEQLITDLNKAQADVEADLATKLDEHTKNVVRLTETDKLLKEEELKETKAQLQETVDNAKKEYELLERLFREKLNDDVTLNVVTAAYAVVASNKPPRDIKDSELVEAVLRHRRSAVGLKTDNKTSGNHGLN